MAKRRKYKSSKSSKCPEPLNTLIDIAGAAALGAYTRHKIIKDYERGQGETSVKAAMLVHGAGAMRRGSDGLVSLGGVYGINSALKAIEKKERTTIDAIARIEEKRLEPLIEPLTKIHTNNNRYAWRLNCEDGSSFGINPEDYETRLEYNKALQQAKEGMEVLPSKGRAEHAEDANESTNDVMDHIEPNVAYRISRLDTGANQFYASNVNGIQVGSKVLLHFAEEAVAGVVLSIHSLEDPAISICELIVARIERL